MVTDVEETQTIHFARAHMVVACVCKQFRHVLLVIERVASTREVANQASQPLKELCHGLAAMSLGQGFNEAYLARLRLCFLFSWQASVVRRRPTRCLRALSRSGLDQRPALEMMVVFVVMIMRCRFQMAGVL